MKNWKNDLRICGAGFAMGSANVIPGVSGGTMAFILGVFEELIDSVRALASPATLKLLLYKEFRAWAEAVHLRFLIALGIGILLSFATMAKLFVWLLKEHEQLTYAFFFGLIAASIISVNRQLGRWTPGAVISFLVSAAAAFGVISMVPVDLGSAWYIILLCGAISIIAMILPGLSGSFLLLLLGQYDRIWSAVGNFCRFKFNTEEFVLIVCFAAGCAIGLGAFAHVLNYLMKRFRSVTIAALIGFMVGSLPRIWPWQHADLKSIVMKKGVPVVTRYLPEWPHWDITLLWIVLAALAGLLLVLGCDYFANHKKKA